MNQTLGILTLVVLLILAAVGGALWYVSRPSQTPATTGGSAGPTYPDNTTTVTTGTASNDSAKAAVAAAYRQLLTQDGNYDNVRLGTTVVAGGYALQEWKGDNTSGEALFEYARGRWTILDSGGGEWGVAELMKFGMDKKTALILLSGIHAGQ